MAWGDGTSRRNPITYHVHHALGTDTFQIDQTSIANVWIQLGTDTFYFNEGYGGPVVMTNEDVDVSGSVYAGAVQLEFLPVDDVVDSRIY